MIIVLVVLLWKVANQFFCCRVEMKYSSPVRMECFTKKVNPEKPRQEGGTQAEFASDDPTLCLSMIHSSIIFEGLNCASTERDES